MVLIEVALILVPIDHSVHHRINNLHINLLSKILEAAGVISVTCRGLQRRVQLAEEHPSIRNTVFPPLLLPIRAILCLNRVQHLRLQSMRKTIHSVLQRITELKMRLQRRRKRP